MDINIAKFFFSPRVSDLVDSATTIKEEVSLESEESIIVFNRAERLAKVTPAFPYIVLVGCIWSLQIPPPVYWTR